MAVSGYFDAVQKIYIAFYQRPADPAGLRYWAERLEAVDGDSTAIINAFANSAEAQRLYGPIDDDTIGDVVGNIYQALFGREPDAAGKAYYEAAFADGTLTAGNIALAILNASKNDDQAVIANKLIVANKFTEKVDGRALDNPEFGKGDDFAYEYTEEGKAEAVRKALAAVTADPKSILNDIGVTDVLEDKVPAPGGGHQDKTFELSTNNDTFTGQSGQDKFVAKLKDALDPLPENPAGGSAQDAAGGPPWQTLNDGDKLAGGGGKDVLEAELIGMNKVTPSLTGIETIALSGMGSLSLANSTGVENIHVNGMDASKLQYGDVGIPEDDGTDDDTGVDDDAGAGAGAGAGGDAGAGVGVGGFSSFGAPSGFDSMDLGIGVAVISVEDIGAPLKSLTITDTLGIVSLGHQQTVSAGSRPLELNLRDAIAVVAISGQDENGASAEPVYENLTINSSSARTDSLISDETAHGNYMLLASPTPSNIVVNGDVNFGLITGIVDGQAPGVLDATGLKGNLAAVVLGKGDTKATAGEGEDLLAFVSPSALDSEFSNTDQPVSKITVDGGAGDDCMVFVSDANVTANGDIGDDNFVFVNLQGSTGFNVGDSVEGGDGTDTLWLATVDAYGDDFNSTGSPTVSLFGEAPALGDSNNISGIEHVVHVGPGGVNVNIEADIARVDGATLELAGDYDSSTVTVNNINGTSDTAGDAPEKTDVIFSGQDVGTLSLNGSKKTINLTVRTMSEDRDSIDWLSSKFGDGPSLDILPALHNADTYVQVLGMLKQTGGEVNIGSLQVGANTKTLNLNLENIGIQDSEHSVPGFTNSTDLDCVGQVNILDMSSLGNGVSKIDINGNADLTLGSTSGVSDVEEIYASDASGNLNIYLKDNDIKITAGSGVDAILFESTFDAAGMSRSGFAGGIYNFNIGDSQNGSVEKDVVGIKGDSSIYAFLKLENVAGDSGSTFEDLFLHTVGTGQTVGGYTTDFIAVMYDAANNEAVLFTLKDQNDGLIDSSDVDSIEILTTVFMSADEYSNFDIDNIAW